MHENVLHFIGIYRTHLTAHTNQPNDIPQMEIYVAWNNPENKNITMEQDIRKKYASRNHEADKITCIKYSGKCDTINISDEKCDNSHNTHSAFRRMYVIGGTNQTRDKVHDTVLNVLM